MGKRKLRIILIVVDPCTQSLHESLNITVLDMLHET